ncbi:hypothetical protein V6N00_12715 [Tersicoccus sp. MR15.9]|uniref:hypothetical protein n=1 Tax=Tersicoccus mangrovi TaxID=3121635 RepID=UPI002FE65FCC
MTTTTIPADLDVAAGKRTLADHAAETAAVLLAAPATWSGAVALQAELTGRPGPGTAMTLALLVVGLAFAALCLPGLGAARAVLAATTIASFELFLIAGFSGGDWWVTLLAAVAGLTTGVALIRTRD